MAAAFFLFLGNPVPLVQQLGAVVVVGLLLDTFVVRPFLVPALVQLLGRRSGISTQVTRSY
jgi:RND superfamily putative drug exporter